MRRLFDSGFSARMGVAMVLAAILITNGWAQNVVRGKVAQPTSVPAAMVVKDVPLPPLDAILSNAKNNPYIYGIYTYKGAYLQHRQDIKQIGWKSFRMWGPLDEEIADALVEDDGQVLKPTSAGTKQGADPAGDQAYIDNTLKEVAEISQKWAPKFKPRRFYLELGNEPNFQYLIKPDNRPQEQQVADRAALYAKLLVAVHQALAGTNVPLVGMAAGGASAADVGFIDQVHKKDPAVAQSYDILSTHPYAAFPDAYEKAPWGPWTIAGSYNRIREIMAAHGAGDKPVWYSEVGWQISKEEGGTYKLDESPATPERKLSTTPELQAAYTCRLYAIAQRLGVECVTNMNMVDTDGYNGGFFAGDGSWRPSAHAVQTMTRLMPAPKLVEAISDGGNGYFAYRFQPSENASSSVIMLWNTPGVKTVTVPVTATQVKFADMLGNEQDVVPANGKVSVEIGPLPVYVQVNAAASARSMPSPSDLSPVRADNPCDLGVVVGPGTVKLANGKTAPVAETHLTFDPPELRDVSIDCKAPKAYADRFSQWDPWPDAQFDPVPEARKIPNAINLCPHQDDQGTLILGGLYRAFLPESVVVTPADGSRTFVKGEDWVYNRNGAQVGNFEGRLGTPGEAPLKISAKYALQRLDLVQVDASGKISVKKGTSQMFCPALPEADADHTALAGIYLAAWNAASNPWYDGQKVGLSAKTDYAISEHEIFPINPAPPIQPINKSALAHSLQKLKDNKELRIAFVGASVTVGAETPAWWDHLWTDQNLGFPSVVVTGLRKRFPQATITPIMASQGGTTAKYGLEVIDKNIIPAKADVVLLDFGGNDANGASGAPPNNPPEQFKEDMRAIIQKSKNAGADVIIVIGHDSGHPWLENQPADRWPTYRQAMLDLAKEENVGAADITTEMDHLASHGIPPFSQMHSAHPGILGHKVYADVILRFFE